MGLAVNLAVIRASFHHHGMLTQLPGLILHDYQMRVGHRLLPDRDCRECPGLQEMLTQRSSYNQQLFVKDRGEDGRGGEGGKGESWEEEMGKEKKEGRVKDGRRRGEGGGEKWRERVLCN